MTKAGFRHTEETKRKISDSHMGAKNPMYGVSLAGENNGNWKGGGYIKDGYVYVYCPDHPHGDKNHYVAEHRIVLEKALGRYLLPSEVSTPQEESVTPRVSSWRPEGWENPYFTQERYDECEGAYESGADAIIVALREVGHYFGVGEAIDEPNFAPSGGRWMNQAGTMVFIPDEK